MPDPFTLHPQDAPLLDVFVHDLRSPLLAVSGYLAEIEASAADLPGSDALLADLAEVKAGCDRMEALVAGLMQICRRSRPSFQIEDIDMDTLLSRAIAASPSARDRQDITCSALPACRGDADALTAAFAHLIDNAARAGGPITVRGEATPDGRLTYTITDSGPGLPAALHPHRFVLFATDTDRDGIGLSLARYLLIQHRGWLKISSTGAGCVVVVSLPQ